jgi:hypothetical protein
MENMNDLKCPYCGFCQEANDIREPDMTHEVECESCGKVYGVTVDYIPSYHETIMPCANGEPHKMVKTRRVPKVINGTEEYHCEYCDHRENRPAPCSENCLKEKSECIFCDPR